MIFDDALEYLRQGKRIRVKGTSTYIKYDKQQGYFGSTEINTISLEDIIDRQWEVEGVSELAHVLEKMGEPDPVNHPTHYTAGNIEVIDILKDQLTADEFKGFCKGNVLKYVMRSRLKGKEKEDCKKASWYLDRMIKEMGE